MKRDCPRRENSNLGKESSKKKAPTGKQPGCLRTERRPVCLDHDEGQTE